MREAKTHTSWIAPHADYEHAILAFGDAILGSEEFRTSFERVQRRIAFHGFLNSLAQLVLKIASPGVPDFYQGTELWDFSLVDPDNRRPVDYAKRRAMLDSVRNADRKTMLRRWLDGRVKMFTTVMALDVRNRHSETFRRGAYRAIDAGANICAFLRGDDVVVAVPRLVAKMSPRNVPLGDVWGDARLNISGAWRNAFTDETVEGDSLPLAQVFATFPVAMLERA